ncbi:MAG: hypothetical protein HY909_09450 [Deltaproteobacteria bacterium]|nr:hypothetical protein [Deltaproteobacteria bacterium]
MLLRSALVATMTLGCVSQGFYTSPRTLAPGRLQHGGYVEFVARGGDRGPVGVFPVPIVGYTARYGLSRGIEGGARINVLGTLGLDVKLQLVRSRGFDLALDPLVVSSWTVGNVHLPLIAGFNLSPRVQVLLGARFSYGVELLAGTGVISSANPCDPSGTDLAVRDIALCGASAGALLGLRLVVGDLALQPEYSVSRAIEGSSGTLVHTLALALSLAPLPDFGPEPPATPEATRWTPTPPR